MEFKLSFLVGKDGIQTTETRVAITSRQEDPLRNHFTEIPSRSALFKVNLNGSCCPEVLVIDRIE